MKATEVSQMVFKLVQFNQRTDDRILVLWWNVSDIEDNLGSEYDEDQLRKVWNGICNNQKVLDAMSHAEQIVEDALSEVVIELDN